MTIQKTLFQTDGKEISFLQSVPIQDIEISKLNPRKTWDEVHITRLAQLIESNSFDKTFALKCYQKEGKYHCFAGSNRLKACQKLQRDNVPIFLYSGYSDNEIWKLAYDDNEQADAQQQFSIVEVWMDYKEKSDGGMTQQQIADTLGVSQMTVSRRLQLYDLGISDVVFKHRDKLTERICLEFLKINTVFKIWDHGTLLLEIIDNILAKYKEPTSTQFKKEVEKYNAAMQMAEGWAAQLSGEHLAAFLEKIATDRSAASIERQGTIFLKKQQEAHERQLQQAQAALDEQKSDALKKARELQKAEKIKAVTDWVLLGDSQKRVAEAPDNIRLIFTDPPYGQAFQSNRKVASAKSDKIANDANPETALSITEACLSGLSSKLATDAGLLLWCSWKYEHLFSSLIKGMGWEIKNSLVWIKPNHGTGDLKHTFAPKHERLLFATKGKVELNSRLPDVFHGDAFLPTTHPTPKPIDAISLLIESLTLEGDIIADPFMGVGSTGVSAIRAGRKFWGCELSKEWWEESMQNIKDALL